MDRPPVSIAFLWHFHQPDYTRPGEGRAEMPWTRLHALKDYTDMAAWVEDNPAARVTFNWVPSLVQQVLDYAGGRLTDDLLEWTRRPAGELSPQERAGLLDWGFRGHPPGIIRPLPRYWELYQRRGPQATEADLLEAAQSWSEQELRDLQVCHLLGWCGESLRRRHPVVKRLLAKQRGFSEEDHREMLETQEQVLGELLPRYRRLLEQDQVELTTSPFYHPILPLLCRMEDARVSRPDLPIPEAGIAWWEDAREHLRRARRLHEQVFGQLPQGMWPSEGSVSDTALQLIEREAFQWAATDEQILAFTLHFHAAGHFHWRELTPQERYRPYRFRNGPAMFFRDHFLSDRIGFDYARMDAEEAVADLKGRLLQIGDSVPSTETPPMVPIILDGENAWEHYPANGAPFFELLYRDLTGDPRLRLVTFSEYLQEFPATHQLTHIFPGSWINHDFHIWAGHPEDNRAWQELATARAHLQAREAGLTPEQAQAAHEHLMVAQGSDWFWWFGDENHSLEDDRFDTLFRRRLQGVYTAIGDPPPASLDHPIKRPRTVGRMEPPRQRLQVTVDGRLTHYFEWQHAAFMNDPGGGAMHRGALQVERIWFGFDHESLFWRIDPARAESAEERQPVELHLLWKTSVIYRLRVPWNRQAQGRVPLEQEDTTRWRRLQRSAQTGVGKLLEIAVAWKDLRLKEGDAFGFALEAHPLQENDSTQPIERWPTAGWLNLKVPTAEFDRVNWWV